MGYDADIEKYYHNPLIIKYIPVYCPLTRCKISFPFTVKKFYSTYNQEIKVNLPIAMVHVLSMKLVAESNVAGQANAVKNALKGMRRTSTGAATQGRRRRSTGAVSMHGLGMIDEGKELALLGGIWAKHDELRRWSTQGKDADWQSTLHATTQGRRRRNNEHAGVTG